MTIPSLPSEIRYLILRKATHVPDLLSTTWNYAPEDRIWDDWDLDASDRASNAGLTTKRAIIQVCRAWRQMGLESLYEAIHFSGDFGRYSRPLILGKHQATAGRPSRLFVRVGSWRLETQHNYSCCWSSVIASKYLLSGPSGMKSNPPQPTHRLDWYKSWRQHFGIRSGESNSA